MFSQLFGQYLLSKKVITPDQLKEILELQNSTHLKLGFLAVEAGYMTTKQVETVHSLQEKVDKKFGELAIELNFLKDKQVNHLLNTQKQGHLLLGQALVDKNYISLEEIKQLMKEFKEQYTLDDDDIKRIEEGDIDEIVNKNLEFNNCCNEILYKEYVNLFFRNVIRFIDSNVYIDKSQKFKTYNTKWFSFQTVYGDLNIFTAISAEEKIFIDIASRFSGEKIFEIDELAEASFSEFLNLQNGIFITNKSNDGVELDLMPQEVEAFFTIENSGDGYVIPVNITAGTFYIILSDKKPLLYYNKIK